MNWKTMTERQRDLFIAEHLDGWSWTQGEHYDVADGIPHIWLLPGGMNIADVPPGEWTWYDKTRSDMITIFALPHYTTSMEEAWPFIERARDKWSAATKGARGDEDFDAPFDDAHYFDIFHRSTDRRWPWAFLYVTPEIICSATLQIFAPKAWELVSPYTDHNL